MSAKVLPYARLLCDAPSCACVFEWHGLIMATRRAAMARGWVHAIRRRANNRPAPTYDFCPDHHSEIERVGAEVREV